MSKILNNIPTPVDSYIRDIHNIEDAEEHQSVMDKFNHLSNYQYGDHSEQSRTKEEK